MKILKDKSISLNKKDKTRILKQLSYKVQIKQIPFDTLVEIITLFQNGNKVDKEHNCYDIVIQVWNELGV